MPVTHAVNRERREMYVTANGPITMDDICKHLSKEHRDKVWHIPS